MKVLALVADQRLPNNDAFYKVLGDLCHLDIRHLDKTEQSQLSRFFKDINVAQYDRIIFDLHFKRIYKQSRYIRTIPNLIILEEDACQNYIPNSKWHNKFLKFYRSLASFRLVCTGVNLTEKLKREGLDVCFLPKGFDHTLMKLTYCKRDIELGFIGRTKSATYAQREQFLTTLQKTMGLTIIRTEPGKEYVETLNRIRYFVSADIGLTEYMTKNFEAMACGCVLIAFRQGAEEKQQGLIDMENIVLYRDINELQNKIRLLQQDQKLSDKIAENGYRLATQNHSYNVLAKRFFTLIEPEIKPLPSQRTWKHWLPF